jgi:transcriptional regulator with XRE-family HTH domain
MSISSNIHDRIAERIKFLRKCKGLSQEQMASALTMTRSAYSKLENGNTLVSHELILLICKKFLVPLDFFSADDVHLSPE